jgi:hypothetical protein
MPLRLAFLFAWLLVASSVLAKSPFDGVWGVESHNCGGPKCEPQDVRNGTARLVFEGLRIRVQGSRMCGVSYNSASKIYRAFVVGASNGGSAHVAYGQEIDHNPDFYKRKHFQELPDFQSQRSAVLRIVRGGLHVQALSEPIAGRGTTVLHRLSVAKQRHWGLQESQQWEPEFMAACLEGSNTSIERTRSGLRPPHAAHVER